MNQHVIQTRQRRGSEILSRFGEGLFGIRQGLPFRMDALEIVIQFDLSGLPNHNRYDANQSHFSAARKGLGPPLRLIPKVPTIPIPLDPGAEPRGLDDDRIDRRPGWLLG